MNPFLYDHVFAAADAAIQQTETMWRERHDATKRIKALKETMATRAAEKHIEKLYEQEHRFMTALEPGWDVVN